MTQSRILSTDGRRVGIDLGGTKIEGVVMEANRPIFRERIATESEGGYRHIVDRVGMIADLLLRRAPDCPVIGVGRVRPLRSPCCQTPRNHAFML